MHCRTREEASLSKPVLHQHTLYAGQLFQDLKKEEVHQNSEYIKKMYLKMYGGYWSQSSTTVIIIIIIIIII